jgi:hypothetical protein
LFTALAVVALGACSATGGLRRRPPCRDRRWRHHAEGTPWQPTDHVGPEGNVVPVPEAVAATAVFARHGVREQRLQHVPSA